MLNRFVEKLKALRVKMKGKAAYRAQLFAAVEDGVLTPEEIHALEGAREELGLSTDDVRSIRVTAYKRAFQTSVNDRRITKGESLELENIRSQLGLGPSEIAATSKEFQRYRLLGEVQEGNLPLITVPGLILQKHEHAHWSERAQLIEERVVRRRYEGGSQGVSIRIMKGVSYRVGAQRGQLVTDTAHMPVSDGDFVITNKRVVFKGNKKSFNYKLDKLLGMELFADGLSLADTAGKNRLVRFATSANGEIVGAILSQVTNQLDT